MEIKKAWIVYKGMDISEGVTKIFTGEGAKEEVFEFVKECLKDLDKIWKRKYKKDFELGIRSYPDVKYVKVSELTDEDIKIFVESGGECFGNYSLGIDFINNE